MGRTGLALRRRAHYKLALMLLNLWEQEHIILYPERAARGKEGVPAEVRINAAVGTVLKGPLNKTENRWGHSRSSFCRDDRIGRVLGLPTGSEWNAEVYWNLINSYSRGWNKPPWLTGGEKSLPPSAWRSISYGALEKLKNELTTLNLL